MKDKTRRILLIVLLGILAVSAALLLWEVSRYRKADILNRELSELAHAQTPRAEQTSAVTGSPAPSDTERTAGPDAVSPAPESSGVLPQYAALYARNGDLAGWLTAEGIGADLPVMYRESEQDYYLYRSFDGEDLKSGTLFLGVPWTPDGSFAIIHGHNMRDGSMFGQLSRYADADFGRENAVIRFDTLFETRQYELVCAFHGSVYPASDTAHFHFYDYADVDSEAGFSDYVKNVKASALYDTGVTPVYGDRLLVLSTCENHGSGRFVAVFRQR